MHILLVELERLLVLGHKITLVAKQHGRAVRLLVILKCALGRPNVIAPVARVLDPRVNGLLVVVELRARDGLEVAVGALVTDPIVLAVFVHLEQGTILIVFVSKVLQKVHYV